MNAAGYDELGAAESLDTMARALYGFVNKVEKPRLKDKSWSDKVRERCTELMESVSEARASLTGTQEKISGLVDELMETLKKFSHELSHGENAARIKELRRQLARHYERLLDYLADIKWQPPLAVEPLYHLKPINYHRSAFHALMGLVCVLLYELVLTRGQALIILLSFLGFFTTLEVSRRFSGRFNDFMVDKVFGAISRPHERFRVNASTYYLAALTIMAFITPKTALCMGLLVLAFGDPAASMAGRRWGEKKLWREKSIAGTGVFFMTSFAVCCIYLGFAQPGMTALGIILLSTVVSGAGAATELFSQRINDNFTIPVVTAGVASFWF